MAIESENSSQGKGMQGRVYLVGAGPGDPKLLTIRAFELLQQAEVVAYDLLISPEILQKAPANAELIPVGRRYGMGPTSFQIHPDIMERASQGKMVVRLKSGDPLLFGRGGEEAEALAAAGIPFAIVPGITAAFGAAAYAGIPLTHRGLTTELLIATGHDADEEEEADETPSAQSRMTVLYMASKRLEANVQRLMAQGYASDTPAALIASATTPRQVVITATLATLADQASALPEGAPVLVLVGTPIALHEKLRWFEPKA